MARGGPRTKSRATRASSRRGTLARMRRWPAVFCILPVVRVHFAMDWHWSMMGAGWRLWGRLIRPGMWKGDRPVVDRGCITIKTNLCIFGVDAEVQSNTGLFVCVRLAQPWASLFRFQGLDFLFQGLHLPLDGLGSSLPRLVLTDKPVSDCTAMFKWDVKTTSGRSQDAPTVTIGEMWLAMSLCRRECVFPFLGVLMS